MVTLFSDLFSKQPFHVSVDTALDRVRTGGKIVEKIAELRSMVDVERAGNLKKLLPCVCFSGKFSERNDAALLEHSGFIVLDFDHVESPADKRKVLSENKHVYAAWISPSGTGVKALVRVADGGKHREHFDALRELWPDIDPSGVNVSRVCFESHDPEIYVNKSAEVWTKVLTSQKIQVSETTTDQSEIFNKLVRWLTSRGDAFHKGSRNIYIYKLASACCRFGINENDAFGMIANEYEVTGSDFTQRECRATVRSAYRSGMKSFSTASFVKDKLVDSSTLSEVEFDHEEVYNETVRAKDVVYGEDVVDDACDIYENGYKHVEPLGHPIDKHYKKRRGEVTGVSGIGNFGKSSFWKWLLICRALSMGEKFGIFTPEETPAAEFYHGLCETILGCDLTPSNHERPSKQDFLRVYEFVTKHFFFIYPESMLPTPEYIKERFLSLIIKEKIDGCIIDPFNQLTNDYGKSGGRSDKYLESFLADCSRFAQQNNVYFDIILHPKQMRKPMGSLDYPCPDVFDLADGALWSAKLDNILIIHRPNNGSDPTDPTVHFYAKKIRRQKIVGITGMLEFYMDRKRRRFICQDIDFIGSRMQEVTEPTPPTAIKPNISFTSSQDIKEQREDGLSELDRAYDERDGR